MADETKGKKRRGRPTKAAVAAAASKQRTLKDMFGGGSKASKPEPSTSQGPPDAVIELSDSEPELTTLPSTPVETVETDPVSEGSSLTTLDGVEGMSLYPKSHLKPFEGSQAADLKATTLESLPPRPPPRKLFAIFERKTCKESPTAELTETTVSKPSETEAEDVNPHGYGLNTRQTRSPSVSIIAGPADRVLRVGGSRDAPIVIESTSPAPDSPKVAARPLKPVYSIFAKPPRGTKAGSSKLPVMDAAVPSKDLQPGPDHTTFPSIPPRFSSREKGKAKEADTISEYDILSRLLSSSEAAIDLPHNSTIPIQHTVNVHDYITTIPQSHQTIPAITRLLNIAREPPAESSSDTLPSSEQWSHKWRPRQADHVLGNEQHALYLRDWLQALRLQGESFRPSQAISAPKKSRPQKRKAGKNKKPDIVRHVKKRRRDGLEDDFLAPDGDFTDEEDVPDAHSSDWDDFEFCREMDARINGFAPSTDVSRGSSPLTPIEEDGPSISYKPTRFGRQISNTILLAGPSGSGKTAAVYACAEELGWEVFEVYPGIGERSGPELNKLIGDVGKNHTVKVHQSPKKTNAKAAVFQRQVESVPKRKVDARRVVDSESEDEIDLLHDGGEDEIVDVVKETTPEPLIGEPTVNQSVILIEEADVLYQTDTGFWPALVNIIKQCRRPLVLTCNDISLIPRDDLPLQATLDFRHCPTPTTASYIQALCLAEQRQVAREDITRCIQQSSDLRRSIQHVQLSVAGSGSPAPELAAEPFDASADVPSSRGGSSPSIYPIDTSSPGPTSSSHEDDVQEQARFLRLADRQCETRSFNDSCLSRSSRPALKNYFLDEPLSNADDELGHIVLYSDVDTDHIPVSPGYLQDLAMASAIAAMIEPHEDVIPLPNSKALGPDLRGYSAQLGSIMYGWQLARGPLSAAALYLEYAPWVRYMAAVDEAQMIALGPVENSQRRRTRNSQKSEQQSWLPLDVETRQALLGTGLRV